MRIQLSESEKDSFYLQVAYFYFFFLLVLLNHFRGIVFDTSDNNIAIFEEL